METKRKSYSEMSQCGTFDERYNYLKLQGEVAGETFGFDRYLNQKFYKSREWKRVRDQVIVRDNGCDMGLKDYPIKGKILIHHINPLSLDEVSNGSPALLDPNNLVCVSHETHNAIHYGDQTIVKDKTLVERRPNDTSPWKTIGG